MAAAAAKLGIDKKGNKTDQQESAASACLPLIKKSKSRVSATKTVVIFDDSVEQALALVERCWAEAPAERPTMGECLAMLEKVEGEVTDKLKGGE